MDPKTLLGYTTIYVFSVIIDFTQIIPDAEIEAKENTYMVVSNKYK